MVLCDVECVHKISQYLQVSPGKVYVTENNVVASDGILKDRTIVGFNTIVQALAKQSRCPGIFGPDVEVEALTRQWLEYAVLCVNYADNFANAKKILKDLNAELKKSTYITGTTRTVADVALYYALHPIMKNLNHQEKAEFVHLSRWFDNLQQNVELRQKLDVINFDLLHLYL